MTSKKTAGSMSKKEAIEQLCILWKGNGHSAEKNRRRVLAMRPMDLEGPFKNNHGIFWAYYIPGLRWRGEQVAPIPRDAYEKYVHPFLSSSIFPDRAIFE